MEPTGAALHNTCSQFGVCVVSVSDRLCARAVCIAYCFFFARVTFSFRCPDGRFVGAATKRLPRRPMHWLVICAVSGTMGLVAGLKMLTMTL